jgi:hypothetical protein
MHAHKPRRFQVHVEIEQTFEPVRHIAGQLEAGLIAVVVGGDEKSGVSVMPVDVLHEPVDQRLVDGVAPQKPAVVNEMRNIVALGRRHQPAGRLPGKPFHRIGAVGPEDPERSISLRHSDLPVRCGSSRRNRSGPSRSGW